MVDVPCHDKQEIRKPIEEFERVRTEILGLAQRRHQAFRPAADRPRDVELSAEGTSSRQNEILERWQIIFHAINTALHFRDMVLSDPLYLSAFRRCKIGTKNKEDLLNSAEGRIVGGRLRQGSRKPQVRIQFIDRAVRFDADGILRDPLPSKKGCLTAVTFFRIDLQGLCRRDQTRDFARLSMSSIRFLSVSIWSVRTD